MAQERTITDQELATLVLYAHGYIDQHTPLYDGARGAERRKLKQRLLEAYRQLTTD